LSAHIRRVHSDKLTITCEICGDKFAFVGGLQRHLISTHKYDDDQKLEYYDKYIKSEDESGYCKYCGKRLKLIKNSFSEGYMTFCYNTDCNVRWHNENTGRLNKFSESFKQTLKENPQNNNTTLEYWTSRGYSTEEAILKQRDRQTTFSKDICIQKHGEEKGISVWGDRQRKWIDNINSKPEEELKRINRLKSLSGGRMSKGEIELAKLVNGEIQYTISSHAGYVYDIRVGNKLIEYNGDYWHCNPNKYSADYYNKSLHMTSKEKWIRDQEKIEYAKAQGYDIMVVWESDYITNKEKVIRECLNFING